MVTTGASGRLDALLSGYGTADRPVARDDGAGAPGAGRRGRT
jgi:hypothetical protein